MRPIQTLAERIAPATDITSRSPSYLSLPNHVHGLVSLYRPPCHRSSGQLGLTLADHVSFCNATLHITRHVGVSSSSVTTIVSKRALFAS